MNPKEIVTKRLGSIAALGLMVLSLIACSGSGNISTANLLPTSTPTPISTENKQLFDEITQYYPEIVHSQAKVNNFETENSSVTVFNFDPSLKIDTTAISQAFSFFEDLASSKQAVKYGVINNRPVNLSLSPQTANKTLFIVIPETAPNPKWLGSENSIADTASLPDINITVVRNDKSKLSEQYLDIALATGVCQSTTQVTSNDQAGMLIGWDVICNSFGGAYYLNPDAYKKYAKDIDLPNKGLNLLEVLPTEFNNHNQPKKMVTHIY